MWIRTRIELQDGPVEGWTNSNGLFAARYGAVNRGDKFVNDAVEYEATGIRDESGDKAFQEIAIINVKRIGTHGRTGKDGTRRKNDQGEQGPSSPKGTDDGVNGASSPKGVEKKSGSGILPSVAPGKIGDVDDGE